jgi:hypothetical protein
MSEFENIQKLIRLKRFENPGEGFTEEFLREFHQRQRAEMLRKSSVELLGERVLTWWNHLTVPKWTLATAAACVCLGGVWLFGSGQPTPQVTTAPPAVVPVVPEKPFIPKLDLSDLPMANVAGRNDSKLEESLLRKHLEVRPTLESKVQALPATGTGLQAPTLHNTAPAILEGTQDKLGK